MSTDTGMQPAQRNRKPTFFWQGLLILLPVFGLAVMGVIFLRQDKSLVMQQARENAQRLSDEVARNLSSQLDQYIHLREVEVTWPTSQTNLDARRSKSSSSVEGKLEASWNVPLEPYRELIQGYLKSEIRPRFDGPIISEKGELVKPPLYAAVPNPPLDRLEQLPLSERQFFTGASPPTEGAWQNFLEKSPPEPFAARARFSLALLQATNQPREAVKLFSEISFSTNRLQTASGLPLQPLATLEWIRLTIGTSQASSESEPTLRTNVLRLASQAVELPSPLTPMLIEEAIRLAKEFHLGDLRKVEAFKQQWMSDELSRELFATLSETGMIQPDRWKQPTAFWVNWRDLDRLVRVAPVEMVTTNGPESAYRLRVDAESLLEVGVLELLDQSRIRLPPYASIVFEISGRMFPKVPGNPKRFPYWVSGPWLDLGQAGYIDLLSKSKGDPYAFENSYNFQLSEKEIPRITNATEILAQTVATLDSERMKVPGLKVQIRLAQPDELFAIQRKRVAIFGSLIAFAAVVALVGFLAAHRGFHRQLRLNEMKSNFVSSVSHELRAPIASVRLMAEGLERGKITEAQKQHEYFHFITQECRRLSSLIENVLDFSRIEQGRKQYEFEPTNISLLTRETVKLMEPYAEEKQVRLQCTIFLDAVVGDVQPSVDGQALQQALINLIDNAIKHSPNGNLVHVRLETTGGALCLSVEDNGGGISPDEHEKIFERFYRLGSELRRETQGVGIGLSIVKHIIEAHGGKILVRSAPGQGSCFTIELPI
jgi:signal transduction histidine kinase